MSWWISALLSAVFAGAVAVLAKIGLEGINSNLATAVRVVFILPMVWAVVYFQGTTGQMRTFSSGNWLFLGLSAVATGLSWLFYFHALRYADATSVAPIDKSSLLFTFLFAAIILGERLTWQKTTAMLLVTAALGVLLIKSPAPAQSPPAVSSIAPPAATAPATASISPLSASPSATSEPHDSLPK